MANYKEMLLSELKPYKKNPRRNSGQAVEAVKESIRQCGYITPIVVDENLEILAGHTRYKALLELGKVSAPVVVTKGLTDEQKRKYRTLDNRTAELSYWNYQALYEELEGLDFGDNAFGFDKLLQAMDQDIDSNAEFTMEDFSDERFKHECPECGFRFN